MRGLANHAGLTLHLRLLAPGNAHHAIEASFKAVARALGMAVVAQPAGGRRAVDQGEPVSPEVVVLDYEMSNLRSAVKALERLGADGARDPRPRGRGRAPTPWCCRASGNFGEAMRRIRDQGLDEAVAGAGRRAACRCSASASGCSSCSTRARRARASRASACCPGAVRRLRTDRKLPHIGWSRVDWAPGAASAPRPARPASSTYYFVHTFGCEPEDPALVLGRRRARRRRSAPRRAARAWPGVQFHPEKSSAAGLGLLGPLARRGAAPRAARRTRDHALPGHRPAGRPGRAPAPGRLRPDHRLQRRPRGPGAPLRRRGGDLAPRRRPRRRPRGRAGARGAGGEHRRGVPGHGPPRRRPALARGDRDRAGHRRRPRRGRHGGARRPPTCWRWAIDRLGDGLVVALDARQGKVATHGWTQISDRDAVEVATGLVSMGVRRLAYTDIGRDGTLGGPNLAAHAAAGRGGPAAAADRLRRHLLARRPAPPARPGARRTWTASSSGARSTRGASRWPRALEVLARGAAGVIRVIPCLDVDRGPGGQGRQLRGPARRRRPGRAGLPLRPRGRRRARLPRHHRQPRGARDDRRARPAHGRGGVHPLHHRRRPALGGGHPRRCSPPAPTRSSLNSAAVRDPELITRASARFGAQCIVVAIDAKRREDGSGWEVFLNGGRLPTGREAVAWAAEAAERGAGELLVTSMDRDGTKDGFDVELLAAVAEAAPVPVIASGGAGTARALRRRRHRGARRRRARRVGVPRRRLHHRRGQGGDGRRRGPGRAGRLAGMRTHPHRGRARARRRRALQPGRRRRAGEGEIVYVSGQLGVDPAERRPRGRRRLASRPPSSLRHIAAVLAEAGGGAGGRRQDDGLPDRPRGRLPRDERGLRPRLLRPAPGARDRRRGGAAAGRPRRDRGRRRHPGRGDAAWAARYSAQVRRSSRLSRAIRSR